MKPSNVAYLPTPQDMEQAQKSSRTLSRYASADRVHLTLRGDSMESEELILPGHVVQILLDALSEMSRGNAVSLIPIHQELSTQEAASLLNVSRPFLVGLLESNAIPFRKVGAHRRVLLRDVIAYKDSIDQKRERSLDELTAMSQHEDMGY
jgi:excisionase family DNA binding protein